MQTSARGSSGFTLIELLAVIVILSILTFFLVTNLTGAAKGAEISKARITAQQIGGAIQLYLDDAGDAPRSSMPSELGLPPNNENIGSECLYLALCKERGAGFGKFDENLSNTDGDSLAKRPEGFEMATLFELCDTWGNPFAYFHHKDYGREDQYVTLHPDTGESLVSVARAIKNAETGRYYEPRGYQLISAGPDGDFATEDDNITQFKIKRD